MVDGEEIAADLLDAACEAVAVEGAEDVEGFEDHQSEGALEDVGFFVVGWRHLGIQQKDAMGPLGKQQGRFFGVAGPIRAVLGADCGVVSIKPGFLHCASRRIHRK